MRRGEMVSILGVCFALIGSAGFYAALVIAVLKYFFDIGDRPSLFVIGVVYCAVLALLFRYQFSVLRKVWWGDVK